MSRSKKLLSDRDVLENLRALSTELKDRKELPTDKTATPHCESSGYGDRLLSVFPNFMELLYEKSGLPLVFVHGDLAEENIITRDGALIIIDWGASCLDIPFGDLRHLEPRPPPARSKSSERKILDKAFEKYLSVWSAYGSSSFLKAVYDASSLRRSYEFVLDDYDFHVEYWISRKLIDRSKHALSFILREMERQSVILQNVIAERDTFSPCPVSDKTNNELSSDNLGSAAFTGKAGYEPPSVDE